MVEPQVLLPKRSGMKQVTPLLGLDHFMLGHGLCAESAGITILYQPLSANSSTCGCRSVVFNFVDSFHIISEWQGALVVMTELSVSVCCPIFREITCCMDWRQSEATS